MSVAEWRSTPWWEQRLLREGLLTEQPWIQRAALTDRIDDPLSLRHGVFSDEITPEPDAADSLEAYGVQIQRSTTVTPLYRPASS